MDREFSRQHPWDEAVGPAADHRKESGAGFGLARTLLLGFGLFGISVLWGIYNALVPIFLQAGRPDFTEGATIVGYGFSTALTGFIMSLDNMAALFILPYIGALSDRTRTRIGRRKPFILVGAPLAALAFIGIPLLAGAPLPLFMAAVFGTLLTMDFFRTPLIALMPDLTPSPLRSQANGVINLMGGLGAVLAFLIGGRLFDYAPWASFAFGALLMLAACATVLIFVREPVAPEAADGEVGLLAALRGVARAPDRSAIALLAAIFCWFLAYSALEVFWTSFATNELQVSAGQATEMLAFFVGAIVLFAVPSGLLGARLGRKRTIMAGLLGFAVTLLWGYMLRTSSPALVMLVLAGISWSLILVNSLPMVVDQAPAAQVGAYTGMYYIASMLASIIGPTLVGAIIWLAGNSYRVVFIYGPLTLLLALGCMLAVRRGEAVTQPVRTPV
jgi:MFS family permease